MTQKKEEMKVVETQVKEEKVAVSQPTETEKSLKVIRELVSKNQDLKIIEAEAKTGFSYFAGKKRLCKLLNTKRGVSLEINVKLPKKFEEVVGMDNISAAMAHKKHLGTMKHHFKSQDSKLIKEIMTAAIEVFKKEVTVAKEEEAKEAKQA